MLLKKRYQNADSTLYFITKETHESTFEKIKSYLFSSKESRLILFNPYIIGYKFQEYMEIIVKKLHILLSQFLSKETQAKFCVLYILRGGLNFSFHKVISDQVEVSFISCQRVLNFDEPDILISEDGYQKINIKNGSTLYVGDISATGITIVSCLKKIIIYCKENDVVISSLIIFMIGTKQSHDYLSDFLKTNNEIFREISLIYIEALFDLYKMPLNLNKNHLLNTDFFLRQWPRTPEFEIEMINNLFRLAERCAIYDGGSRAFEPDLYANGIKNYWTTTQLSFSDYSLLEYICLKTDFSKYEEDFKSWQESRSYFNGLTIEENNGIYNMGRKKFKELGNISINNYFYNK